jgi:hypothetical protein
VEAFYRALSNALEAQTLSGKVAARVLLQAVCEGRRRMLGGPAVLIGRRSWWIPTLSLRYDEKHEEKEE